MGVSYSSLLKSEWAKRQRKGSHPAFLNLGHLPLDLKSEELIPLSLSGLHLADWGSLETSELSITRESAPYGTSVPSPSLTQTNKDQLFPITKLYFKWRMSQETCLYCCSETTTGVKLWFRGWNPHSAGIHHRIFWLAEMKIERYRKENGGAWKIWGPFWPGKVERRWLISFSVAQWIYQG